MTTPEVIAQCELIAGAPSGWTREERRMARALVLAVSGLQELLLNDDLDLSDLSPRQQMHVAKSPGSHRSGVRGMSTEQQLAQWWWTGWKRLYELTPPGEAADTIWLRYCASALRRWQRSRRGAGFGG